MAGDIVSPVQVTQTRIGTIAAGTDDERTVFVAPTDCVIEKVYFTVGTTVSAGATNYTTIDLHAKGAAGTGTDQLAEFDTNTGGTTLTAFVPNDFGDLSNNYITKGHAVSIVKTDSGSGDAVDEAVVTVVWRPQGGLGQFTA